MSVSQNAESSSDLPAPAGTEPPRAESGREGRFRRLASLGAWCRSGIGLVSSIVMLVMGSLTVVFLLIPSLKPSPPPSAFGATLSDASIEAGVVLSSYYARLRERPPATLAQKDLAATGAVVSFTVVIQGFQGRNCEVRWSVFDAKTNQRSTLAWLVNQPGWPAQTFTPAGDLDQGNGEIFVPYPPAPGTYFARIELYDPNGTRLATIDSPVFEAAAAVAPNPVGLPTGSGS